MGHDIIETSINSLFESIKQTDTDGAEFWYARDLFPLLGYTRMPTFKPAILRAKQSLESLDMEITDHMHEVMRMIKVGKNANVSRYDYKLSRYACYLIAQNGDPRKEEIAIAQSYFAIQTRKQEILTEQMQGLTADEKRLYLRNETKNFNKQLFKTAQDTGVKNFGKFNNKGYMGLYGGLSLQEIKHKKQIEKDDLLDRAGAEELAANAFRMTQTESKLRNDNIDNEKDACETHYNVGNEIRETIKKLGGTMPENLEAKEHIKNIEKRIKADEKRIVNSEKPLKIKGNFDDIMDKISKTKKPVK